MLIEAGLNISRGPGLHTDRVWQVCTVCTSLVCVMARYEARPISIWLPYSDPQSNLSLKYTIDIMLPSVRRNVNVLIEAGGFYSRKYGIRSRLSRSELNRTFSEAQRDRQTARRIDVCADCLRSSPITAKRTSLCSASLRSVVVGHRPSVCRVSS